MIVEETRQLESKQIHSQTVSLKQLAALDQLQSAATGVTTASPLDQEEIDDSIMIRFQCYKHS